MKKVYLILTLFVASLFFYFDRVYAATASHVVDEKDFLLLNDEFYLLREKSIEYANNYNKYYIIYNTTEGLRVTFYNPQDTYWQPVAYDGVNYVRIQLYGISSAIFKLNGDVLYQISYDNKVERLLYDTSYENKFSYASYLDTNIENVKGIVGINFTLTLNYNDFSYTVNSPEHLPSLYEFSLLAKPPEDDSDELPRNESLDSFCNLIIEKIQLLANYFITNPVLLFVIGIIILIFISELIFRRLL